MGKLSRKLHHSFVGFVCALSVVMMAERGHGQVVSYEGDSFPESVGWERAVACEPERAIQDSWFVQVVEVDCGGPPGGDRDSYSVSLDPFAGVPSFFLEWRVITTGDRSEIVGVAPAALATSDLFGISYHFTVARDQVRLIRDNFLPIVFVDVAADQPHTYRLELRGAKEYVWYIDDAVVDSGVPEGSYPTPTSVLLWRARAWHMDSTTRWDFVRFGVIPQDGSGDYDSDGTATLFDHYYVRECVADGGPDVHAGPGCRFTDFDGDTDADLLDFAEFQNLFNGP